MDHILSKYAHCGSFIMTPTDNLRCICNAPYLPGIYLFYAVSGVNKETLKYIGKSGTILQNGGFKGQLLCGRICNTHDGKSRDSYLKVKLEQEFLKSIKVKWYVTFENELRDLPGYVEGLLMQEFYQVYDELPNWNACF